MKAGVPATTKSAVIGAASLVGRLDEAEVEDLDEIERASVPADVDVRRLDVAVDQSGRVRLPERVADLPQEIHHAPGRQRPELPHEVRGVEALEQLHHVVERPLSEIPKS